MVGWVRARDVKRRGLVNISLNRACPKGQGEGWRLLYIAMNWEFKCCYFWTFTSFPPTLSIFFPPPFPSLPLMFVWTMQKKWVMLWKGTGINCWKSSWETRNPPHIEGLHSPTSTGFVIQLAWSCTVAHYGNLSVSVDESKPLQE